MNSPSNAAIRERLIIPARPDAPIACDMRTARDSPEARLTEYGRLFSEALVARARDGTAVEFTFAAKPGIAAWVSDLAQREAACCPFCTHEVAFDVDRVVWRTSSTAGPAAEAMLDEFYSLPEHIQDGLGGLFERLAGRRFPVASPAPNRFVAGPGILQKLKSACGC